MTAKRIRKEIMLLLFATFALALAMPVCAAATDALLIGDANGDGRVTSADASFLARYVAQRISGAPQPLAADDSGSLRKDVNCDGEVDLTDVVRLARWLVGHFDSLCPYGGCERCDPGQVAPQFTADDFVLRISVEEATLPLGEDFTVNVELTNISHYDTKIVTEHLFWPSIKNWHWLDDWRFIGVPNPLPQVRLMEAGSILRNVCAWGEYGDSWSVGRSLGLGVHELRFRADFRLYECGYNITVWSNPITLTVTKDDTPTEGFVVTISVNDAILPQGENFRVEVEIKNTSDEDVAIITENLFRPYIYGWHWSIPPTPVYTILLEPGGVLRNIDPWRRYCNPWSIGRELEPGIHELRFRAGFRTREGEPLIEVWSNAVLLTVL